MTKCSIPVCVNDAWARGWCHKHYYRWHKNGDPLKTFLTVALSGEPAKFVEEALANTADECLTWPFAANNRGYAQLNVGKGKKVLVHRLICERMHGPAPQDRPFAIHSCGNGHLRCVAPKHIRWGSKKENTEDMIRHGRSTRGRFCGQSSRLTEDNVLAIFRRAHAGENQPSIAREFGITQTAVSRIKLGRIWGWLTKEDAPCT